MKSGSSFKFKRPYFRQDANQGLTSTSPIETTYPNTTVQVNKRIKNTKKKDAMQQNKIKIKKKNYTRNIMSSKLSYRYCKFLSWPSCGTS